MTFENDWIGLSKEEAVRCIADETGRDMVDAEILFRRLTEVHESIRPAVSSWLCRKQIDLDLSVEGWSIRRLIDEYFCKHVSEALTWLDGLTKQPAFTLEMLNTPRHRLGEKDAVYTPKKGDGH